MELNSALVSTAALRFHRRIKLASPKYFPLSFYFQHYLGNLFFFSCNCIYFREHMCPHPFPSLYLLFSYDTLIKLIILNHEAWKIMTFFSIYCYYEASFCVVLLRRHCEMHLGVRSFEHVGKSCLTLRASFSPQGRWVVPVDNTGLEEPISDSGLLSG